MNLRTPSESVGTMNSEGPLVDLPSFTQARPPSPPRLIREVWELVDVGHSVMYGRCPSCGVARVTEYCPPPCNTASKRWWRSQPAFQELVKAAQGEEYAAAGAIPPTQLHPERLRRLNIYLRVMDKGPVQGDADKATALRVILFGDIGPER